MAEPAFQEPLPPLRPMYIDPAWKLPTEAELPFTDGKPLPDSDYQRSALVYAADVLADRFADRDDVAVRADMFVHYLAVDENGRVILDDNGEPVRRMVAPDVFVSFGVPERYRDSYVNWEEGKPPDFVLEVLSPSTWRHDVRGKKEIYRRMGVAEYWVVDEKAALMQPPVQGFRLVNKAYRPITPRPISGARRSDLLGVEFGIEDGRLRIRDSATGEGVPYGNELRAELEEATATARREAAARMEAERRIKELEARLRGR